MYAAYGKGLKKQGYVNEGTLWTQTGGGKSRIGIRKKEGRFRGRADSGEGKRFVTGEHFQSKKREQREPRSIVGNFFGRRIFQLVGSDHRPSKGVEWSGRQSLGPLVGLVLDIFGFVWCVSMDLG